MPVRHNVHLKLGASAENPELLGRIFKHFETVGITKERPISKEFGLALLEKVLKNPDLWKESLERLCQIYIKCEEPLDQDWLEPLIQCMKRSVL